MTNWVQNYPTQNEDLAALPVERRSRYSLHLRRGKRERLALVSGAPRGSRSIPDSARAGTAASARPVCRSVLVGPATFAI